MKSRAIPAIRFAEFNDTWDQRKLSEYLDVSNEKNTEEAFTKQDVLSVSGDFGIVNQTVIRWHDAAIRQLLVPENAIVI